jgi:hypothetical protein
VSLDNLEVNGLQWRKSRRSIGNGACVEAAAVPASGQIGIRDSTDRNGPVIRYTERSWRTFVARAKEGRLLCGYTAAGGELTQAKSAPIALRP